MFCFPSYFDFTPFLYWDFVFSHCSLKTVLCGFPWQSYRRGREIQLLRFWVIAWFYMFPFCTGKYHKNEWIYLHIAVIGRLCSMIVSFLAPTLLNFLMLNSTEHELYQAHKCVGILTFEYISMIKTTCESLKARKVYSFKLISFMSCWNFMLRWLEHENIL